MILHTKPQNRHQSQQPKLQAKEPAAIIIIPIPTRPTRPTRALPEPRKKQPATSTHRVGGGGGLEVLPATLEPLPSPALQL